jgi:hypothetical protein
MLPILNAWAMPAPATIVAASAATVARLAIVVFIISSTP